MSYLYNVCMLINKKLLFIKSQL